MTEQLERKEAKQNDFFVTSLRTDNNYCNQFMSRIHSFFISIFGPNLGDIRVSDTRI